MLVKIINSYKMKSLCAIVLLIIFFSSCKKDDLKGIQLDYENVKVYDDTLSSAENVNVHVSSGKNRLYMSYGRGSTVYSLWNWGYFQSQPDISGVVMATDLNGDLIWRNSLPIGLANVTPVELADGSCLVAGTNMYAYNPSVPTDKIYLFHYDINGKQIKTDSIVLPVGVFYVNSQFLHLDLLRLSGNDVLLYGTTYSNDNYNYRGFAVKYNVASGIAWAKPIDFILPNDTSNSTSIYNCIKTNDGGLIFAGCFDGPDEPGDPAFSKNVVIKTTIDCDTVWKKWYDYIKISSAFNQVSPTNIIQLSDNSYYLSTNDGSYDNVLIFKGLIYHLNSDGDSIGGAFIEGKRNSYCSGIVEDGNNGIVGLFNKYPDYIFNQFETYYQSFNTELYSYDYDLNFKSQDNLQAHRTDFITSLCKTSDGRSAFFGLTSSYDHRFYKPVLILKN